MLLSGCLVWRLNNTTKGHTFSIVYGFLANDLKPSR